MTEIMKPSGRLAESSGDQDLKGYFPVKLNDVKTDIGPERYKELKGRVDDLHAKVSAWTDRLKGMDERITVLEKDMILVKGRLGMPRSPQARSQQNKQGTASKPAQRKA